MSIFKSNKKKSENAEAHAFEEDKGKTTEQSVHSEKSKFPFKLLKLQ